MGYSQTIDFYVSYTNLCVTPFVKQFMDLHLTVNTSSILGLFQLVINLLICNLRFRQLCETTLDIIIKKPTF